VENIEGIVGNGRLRALPTFIQLLVKRPSLVRHK
jgi:hypothetical protein